MSGLGWIILLEKGASEVFGIVDWIISLGGSASKVFGVVVWIISLRRCSS